MATEELASSICKERQMKLRVVARAKIVLCVRARAYLYMYVCLYGCVCVCVGVRARDGIIEVLNFAFKI